MKPDPSGAASARELIERLRDEIEAFDELMGSDLFANDLKRMLDLFEAALEREGRKDAVLTEIALGGCPCAIKAGKALGER